MKKLLILLLFAMTLPFINVLGATETITYDLTFLDNTYWNLETGALSTNNDWASTNRLTIHEPIIDISGSQVHHVLFWTSQNVYMGYYNIESTYIGTKHLGNSGYEVTVPLGAGKFVAMVHKTGVDTIVPQLPTYSYDDIFSSPSYLGYTDNTLTDTLGNVFANPTYLTTNLDFFGITLALSEIINGSLINAIQLHPNPEMTSTTGYFVEGGTFSSDGYIITTITNNAFSFYNFRTLSDINVTAKLYISTNKISSTHNVSFQYSVIGQSYNNLTTNLSNGFNSYIIPEVNLGRIRWLVNTTDVGSNFVIDNVFLFNISTLISNKARNDAGTLFSSLTDANIKTAMDGWQSNGYLFNDKVFQIWYMKSYHLPTIPDDSGWVYEGNNVFSYDLSSEPVYTQNASNTVANILDVDPFYTVSSYDDVINNSPSVAYYGQKLYVFIDTFEELADFYNYIDSNPLGNIRIGLPDSLSDNEALYYWNLYKDAINQVDRWEWYSFGGVTSSNYAYYTDLYVDAVLETERYEWYTDFGITSTNYSTIRGQYDYLSNYGTGISFASFQVLEVTYDREEVIPPPQKTWLEAIEDYLDDLGLGTFAYIMISLLIMGLVIIPLAIFKASFILYVIVEGSLFTMFSIFGWFPLWLVILVVIALFVLIILQFTGGGNSDS